jgi:Mg-chelatase subunit ChlD
VTPAIVLRRDQPGPRGPGGPLSRRPKTLDEAPLVFRRQGGRPLAAQGKRGGKPLDLPGSPGPGVTDEVGRRRELSELFEDTAIDPAVARSAQQIAARLSVRRRAREHDAEPGPGRPASRPYRGDADDIDIDRTIEALIGVVVPTDDDIVVRTPVRARRAVALVVDVSGSMKGEKVKVVAAAVGALAGELAGEDLAVVAFWKDCALLKGIDGRVAPRRVLDDLLRLPARGLTNLNAALALAGQELARSAARQRVAVILSDCVHNAGPDPREVVGRVPRLHVLLEALGEHDAWMGRELARLGGGRMAQVRGYRDVAPAMNVLLRT